MQGQWIVEVREMIHRISRELLGRQSPEGTWPFCFESGVMTDAYYLLLHQVLSWPKTAALSSIIERILDKQTADGTWKTFPDEREGSVSATLDASVALLYAGIRKPTDPALKKARDFLLAHGGVNRASSLTKVMLALLGHRSWSRFIKLPVEFFLLPVWSPVNFFDFVGYTRVHVAPIILVSDQDFYVRLQGFREVEDWLPASSRAYMERMHPDYFWTKEDLLPAVKTSALFREKIHERAIHWGENFLLSRIEEDGTLYSYMTSTFLLIFALLSLKYPTGHQVIQKAMDGLAHLIFPLPGGAHLQETTSTIWDTSLVMTALQKGGIFFDHFAIQKGMKYLLSKQHTKWGDWHFRNPCAIPGGWGFSHSNTINPDVDDTVQVLEAIAPTVRAGFAQDEWKRGLQWLLNMQNGDGGWPAFEKNTNKAWLRLLPYRDGKTIWGDPSTADLTGRVLSFLGSELKWTINRPEARRAWSWLYHHQRADGSWFGRWGISYIYGTWAALKGLAAVGVPADNICVQKGIRFLLNKQRSDGGWGESCYSDVEQRFVSLSFSTPVQTAWALDALIACHDQPTPAIEKGILRLLELMEEREPEVWSYPTGAGLAGQFYINYHSYPYVWPLITLSHYLDKYGS
ncbi:terpene cyclase/mutase family protein [Thermoactinomyces mirandus]|uniref:Squalene--hopene cyclase n=1 Tax=Thermoactinomyces mirandus TaxID=2756294 RepID=A0A7W1XTA5_9BACL|nr:prenyltransferase/squalene oxidase repeat-containing protein [Thermoactinomyces mirandus]MBA4602829.1 squalene--hopene cyclase [Thermoactinomyces mirandus]